MPKLPTSSLESAGSEKLHREIQYCLAKPDQSGQESPRRVWSYIPDRPKHRRKESPRQARDSGAYSSPARPPIELILRQEKHPEVSQSETVQSHGVGLVILPEPARSAGASSQKDILVRDFFFA